MSEQQLDLSGGGLPEEIAPTNRLAGIETNWSTGEEWTGHPYAEIALPDPDEVPMKQWEPEERRAYLLALLREHGHKNRIPMHQKDLGAEFGVSQQAISQDFKELQKYIRFHAGETAIAQTELIADKAVRELMDDDEWYKAWRVQHEFADWVFETGRVERAPQKKVNQNINTEVAEDGLTEREEELIASMAEKLKKGQSATDEVIDAEYREVESEVESDGGGA